MLKFFQKTTLLIIIAIFALGGASNKAHALIAVPTNTMLETAPSAIKRTADTTMLQVKGYVLDGLAWTVAKIMLQQVTASVVNWINSGFEGSPAFLTNPGAFFADTADQITGAFIASNGTLSRLCSPFSIDIRLGLALSSTGQLGSRYTCTLSTVIQNLKNSSVNVNGQVTYNGSAVAGGGVSASGYGASVDGFVNGDFNQGGWPAFIAMTTEPQNNIYGAFLQAKSDLDYQIATKQNNIRLDLQMGRGFMSWQQCHDVNVDNLDEYSDLGVDTSGLENSAGAGSMYIGQAAYSGSDVNLNKKVGKDGKVQYQACETQTPGSVIAGSIDKSLGIPQDTLNIAGSLNQIVGALFAQLVSKVLSGGLHASSNYSYQGSASAGVASQLLQQQTAEQLSGTRSQLSASLSSYAETSLNYTDLRQQSVDVLNASKTAYEGALACFQGKLSLVKGLTKSPDQIYAESQINTINSAIAKVTIAVNQYNTKLSDALSKTSGLHELQNEIANAVTTDDINRASTNFNAAMQSGTGSAGLVSATDIADAQTDLEAAKSQADVFAKNAQQFQAACNNFNPAPNQSGYSSYQPGPGYFNGYSGNI